MLYDDNDVIYSSKTPDPKSWLTPEGKKDEPGFAGDFGRAVVSGGYGIASDFGGLGEYAAGEGGASTALKKFGEEGEKSWRGSMSERGQKELGATFIPMEGAPSIWDNDVSLFRSLALKAGASLPSLAATLVPAGVVGRIASVAGKGVGAVAGSAAAGATAGAMNAGAVYNGIVEDMRKVSDEKLIADNPVYRAMRERGADEATARKELEKTYVGIKPLIMGAITMALSGVGVEGMVAARAAGAEARGVMAGIRRGAAGEAVQEGIEEGVQSGLQQTAGVQAGISEYDWRKLLDQTLQGATIGAILGGTTGAVTERNPHKVTSTGDPKDPIESERAAVEARGNGSSDSTSAPTDAPAPPSDVAGKPGDVNEADVNFGEDAPIEEDPPVDAVTPAPAPAPQNIASAGPEVTPEVTEPPAAQNTDVTQDLGSEIPVTSPVAENVPVEDPPVKAPPVEAPLSRAETSTEANTERLVQDKEAEANAPVEAGKTVRERIAAASDDLARTGERIRSWANASSGAFAGASIDSVVKAARQAVAKRQGDDSARQIVSLADQRKVVRGGRRAAIEDKIAAIRDEVAAARRKIEQADIAKAKELTAGRFEVDEAVGETERFTTKTAADWQTLRRVVSQADADEKAKAIIVATGAKDRVGELAVRATPTAKVAAIKERFTKSLAMAKAQGIKVPTELGTNTPNNLAVLYWRNVMRNAVTRSNVDEVISLDALAVRGAPDEVVKYVRMLAGERTEQSGGAATTVVKVRADDEQDPTGVYAPASEDASAEEAADIASGAVGKNSQVARGRDTAAAPAADEPAYRASVQSKPFTVEGKKRKVLVKPAVPSEAQKEAGNYQKKHINHLGLNIAIETAKGQDRSGVSPDGTAWSVKMPADYGYIKRTLGKDGDHVDAYVGPKKGSPLVVIIDQRDLRTGKFDEHKAFVGFDSIKDVQETYRGAFSDGKADARVAGMAVLSMPEFKEWLKNPTTRPAAEEFQHVEEDSVLFRVETVAERMRRAFEDELAADGRKAERENMTWPDRMDALAAERGVDGKSTLLVADLLDETAIGAMGMSPLMRAGLDHIIPILRNAVGHISVTVATEAEIASHQAVVDAGIQASRVGGFWTRDSKDIWLNTTFLKESPENALRLVVHESLHALTQQALDSDGKLYNAVNSLILHTMRSKMSLADQYGMTNPHEFIAEAFSNQYFQRELANISIGPAEMQDLDVRLGSPRTAWAAFIRMVRRALNGFARNMGFEVVPDSVLEALAVITDKVSQRAVDPNSGFAPAPNSILLSYQRPTPSFVTPQGKARRAAIGGWFKKFGTKFAHLEYLRQLYSWVKDDKGSIMDQIVYATQRVSTASRALQEEGQQLAGEFLKFKRANPKAADAFGNLAITATSLNARLLNNAAWTASDLSAANAHLGKDAAAGWQAKANLAAMQREFMRLPPEARELWVRLEKFYRARHEAVVEEGAKSLLRQVPGLSPADAAAILTRAVSKSLTDTDKAAIGDTTAFNALKRMGELHTIEGTYFPMMRHGSHAVRIRLRLDNLMGGVLVEPNVIEFKAADDKAARAMAKAFAEKTDIPISSIKKTYYLGGKRVSATDAAGHTVDHAYRITMEREGVFFFDTATEAEKFRGAAAKDYDKVSRTLQVDQAFIDNSLSDRQLSALVRSVKANPNVAPEDKADVANAVHQAALRMLGGSRIQKTSIQRRGVVGASEDIARSTLKYGDASAGYIARARNMPDLREGMQRLRTYQKDNIFGDGAGDISNLIADLENRINGSIEHPTEPNSFIRSLLALSFLDKLASPAYSLINAMQPYMVTYPYLAGKFGGAEATMALSRAYGEIGFGQQVGAGLRDTARAMARVKDPALDTTDIFGSIKRKLAKTKDGAALERMMGVLAERGAVDPAAGFEVDLHIKHGAGPTETAISRVSRVARQLPAAVEQVNRAVSAIAAFRLAKAKGKSTDEAIQLAYETVMMTQFDYSTANMPAFMQAPLARVVLQFKKFAINMATLMGDMLHRSLKGATPEEKAAARRQIAHLFAVQMVMAGALSLPGVELFKLAGLVAGMAGLGGFGDWERWLRKFLDAKIGRTPREALLTGLPRAAGIDISNRVSLADMFIFGEPRDNNREGIYAFMGQLMAGAPVSLVVDWMDVIRNAGEGDFSKAIQKAIPLKIADDFAKAQRGYREGKVSATEAAIQTFGVRPSTVARQSEKIGDSIDARKDEKSARKRLEKAYIEASSPVERAKALSRIKDFNKKVTSFRERIAVGGLDRIRQRNEAMRRGETVE